MAGNTAAAELEALAREIFIRKASAHPEENRVGTGEAACCFTLARTFLAARDHHRETTSGSTDPAR